MEGNPIIFAITTLLFLAAIAYTSYLGHSKTKNIADFAIAGRSMGGLFIALSYGAALISTAAIVGFGGIAGLFGYSVYWGILGNMVIGTTVAFIVYGRRVRIVGERLDAISFPDLMGKRFHSKHLQTLIGSIIYIFIPAYTSIILIGGAIFVSGALGIEVNTAIIILSVIVLLYVLYGGLIGVIYTDALIASIMFIAGLLLLGNMFNVLGGISSAHQALGEMSHLVPENLAAAGHTGWASNPVTGSPFWWTVFSTIVLGITIGTLAQPQLAVKMMAVKNSRNLFLGIAAAGLFIWVLTGGAEIVGILSNVYFYEMFGTISIAVAEGNPDMVIPLIIREIMPEWFVYLFMLGLIGAAMSTTAALMHLQGVSLARDVIGVWTSKPIDTKLVMRIGTIIGLIMAVVLAFILPPGVIARATVFWFGLCAVCWLPAYTGCLFWRGATKAGALASVIVGFAFTLFWYTFVKASEAVPLGISLALTGKEVLFAHPWSSMDPLVLGIPLSASVLIIVSLFTEKLPAEETKELFKSA